MTAPPYAILVWTEGQDLWAAPQGQPEAAISFRLSTGGLEQALTLIGTYKPADAEPYVRPQVIPKSLAKENLTLEDFTKAHAVLKELGIIR